MTQAWRPKEMEGEFYGPVRLREALAHSRNLVSVRLVRDIGVEYTRDYVTRFGFDKAHVPDDLTMALGTAEFSPLQVVDRLCDVRERRLSRDALLHRPHSGCGRQDALSGGAADRLRAVLGGRRLGRRGECGARRRPSAPAQASCATAAATGADRAAGGARLPPPSRTPARATASSMRACTTASR